MGIHVTVWNENRTKPTTEKMREIYPDGIHSALKSLFEEAGCEVRTALLDDPENGLQEELLEWTDVLVYWSHVANEELSDEISKRIRKHVLRGMGFIPLHSAHMSKPFRELMGTSCTLDWRESEDREHLWCMDPKHPIASGVDNCIILQKEETYREFFDIPEPDQLVFMGWFSGGEVFRSGVCYFRGQGKIFYFQPGHETYPNYYHAEIRKILINAVRWAYSVPKSRSDKVCNCVPPILENS